jgi:CubicO group peptidase (beta-lactamase class C family)
VHHTSGIRDWVELFAIAGWRFDDVIGVPDILTLARHQQQLNFEPGADYRYSNTGYNMLAEIVARVTGDPFPAYLRRSVLRPLGMDETHSHANHHHLIPDRARSYEPSEEAPGGFALLVNNTTAVGSSSIFTTAEDMAKWLVNYRTHRVGTERVWKRMHRRGVLNSGDTIDYAYGLSRGTYGGHETVGHGGSWRGFRSQILWVNGPDLGVAVLANRTDGRPDSLAREVVQALVEDFEESPSEQGDEDEPEEARDDEGREESPVPIERYEGQ